MATFPSLVPTGRTYTPGEYPHTPFDAYNGLQSRVRHSNVMLASQIRLQFTALSESEVTTILNHYKGQYGTFDSFNLPSTVWSDTSSASEYQLTSYLWRYVEAPVVDNFTRGHYDVRLVLESTPPDAAILDGTELTVKLAITAGRAYTASGLSRTVSVNVTPGVITLPGITAVATSTLTSGTAAAANGAQLSVVSSLTAAAAYASSGLNSTVSVQLSAGVVQTDDQWISMYYDFEPFPYEDATGIFLDWNPPLSVPPVAPSSYFADMSSQMFGWEGLAYIEWWGN